MFRIAPIIGFALCLFATNLRAADSLIYSITPVATRSGDFVSVSMKIVQHQSQSVPGAGSTDVATTLMVPRVKMSEGKQATITSGKPKPDSKNADDVDSGIRVEIISLKGQDKILIVTTVIRDGFNIFADAVTVNVTVKPAADAK